MRYGECLRGLFKTRLNRFEAMVEIAGKDTLCHVKNTGRCRELLLPGSTVILEKAANPNRKTAYDLIAVYKGERLINMDSQAPNKVAAEWLAAQFPDAVIQPEVPYGESRLDFAMTYAGEPWLIEVKGCTLEVDGVGYFPDAPTTRGVKHLHHLIQARQEGYRTAVLFMVQMEGITALRPNDSTHPAFGKVLREAAAAGVAIWAVGCTVCEDSLTADPTAPTIPVEL